MAFRPSLLTSSLGVSAEAAFIASEHLMGKRVGVTLDSTVVGADANGDKILTAGTVLQKITATGKYGPYNATEDDGRELITGDLAFLRETVNLRNGDEAVGVLLHGSVIEARTSGVTSSVKTSLSGRIVFQ